MTFHESYGNLAKSTLSLIRKHNVSPADYDDILAAFGWDWTDPDAIDFTEVNKFILSSSKDGSYRPSRYL